jgi:hypothetical protein
VTQFFATQARLQQGHTYRVEAQQALRATLDTITRDVRLAGACLPITGAYVPIAGTDGPGPDTITVRTGIIRDNLTCVWAGVRSPGMAAGASVVPVDTVTGFSTGMLAYLRHPAGSGQFLFVTAVGATTVTLSGAASIAYPQGSGLYAIDERAYAVDTTIPGQPRLMLTVDRGDPQVFAVGINDLQARYVLNRDCDPCDVVDAPAATDTATWRLVNDVLLTATVETVGTVRPEDEATITQTSRAKPRNLLP